jgi:hypothetical protein
MILKCDVKFFSIPICIAHNLCFFFHVQLTNALFFRCKKGDKLDCKNYQGICNAHYCDVLRQNTKRLFQTLETRQELRQGDVLYTLLFNVVLEVIVRRANLQTTGTI